MLSWFYKFRPLGTPVAPPKSAAVSRDTQAPAGPAVVRPPAVKAPAVPRADPDGPQRLQAALGVDSALLQLALAAKGLELKLAAVQAIIGETTLKQAEREFRGHDRKVHRLAKQRLETTVSQREGRAQADRLLAHTAALLQEAQVPLNHVAALDRDWSALPLALLQDSQTQQFTALRGQLEQVLRERSDAQQRLQRWTLDVKDSLRPGAAPLLVLAEQGPCADAAAQVASLQALQAVRPEAAVGSPQDLALSQRLAACQALAARLAWLEQHEGSAQEAAVSVAEGPADVDADADANAEVEAGAEGHASVESTAEGSASAEAKTDANAIADADTSPSPSADADADAGPIADTSTQPIANWADLPEVADPAIDQALQQRFERWQQQSAQAAARSHSESSNPAPAAEAAATAPVARGPKRAAMTAEQIAPLDELLQQAEAAQSEGQLAVMQQRLQAFEALAPSGQGAAMPGRLRARHQALRAESLRLRDWQRWGGSQARDVLVAEAEALARLTVETSAPPAAGAAAVSAGPFEGAEAALAPAAPAAVAPAETTDATEAEAAAAAGQGADLPDQPELANASGAAPGPAAAAGGESAAPHTPSADAPPSQPQMPSFTLAAEPSQAEGPAADPAAPQAPGALHRSALLGTPEAMPAANPAPERAARRRRPKLKLQPHADAIAALRARWKALDRTGAAAPQELWQRFDAALQTAFEPVAVQHAVQKAARHENLAAREALLASLEMLAPAEGGPPAEPRALQQGLDRFQLAWRRLGPIEHTAPQASRAALSQRLDAVLARAELPLQAARAAAVAQREKLIAQALALQPEGQDATASPDSARQVRELQFAWQEQARSLPLPRGVEREVWGRFKAATDAVFAQREAAFAARDAEMAANLAAAEALLQRLAALTAETPAAERQRTLAEVDRAWRQGGPVPRGAVERLEKRYASLCAAQEQQREGALRHGWQAQCDGLTARLAVCEAREAHEAREAREAGGTGEAGEADAASLDERWAGLQALSLPPAWHQALAQRWQRPASAGPLPAAALDELLLQLEMALGLPASAEQQAAARQLKLRALKESMEGRAPAKTTGALPADWLLAVLRQACLTSAQQQRLQRWLAALRQAQPGSLGLPLPAA